MKLESQGNTIQKPAREVYDFLTNIKNFEKLMPENISKFEVIDETTFVFALKGMPEIPLKLQDSIPVSKVILGAGGGKIDFSLTGDITEIDETSSSVKLSFEGNFNPMMAMMIKGPITKFLETLNTNLPVALDQ
ncbi:MAG: SRPBCC family protein [Flavobacteriaceae bacterium]|nr:SRPBCC family protein [Mangrovimonas sp.]MCB0427664.1 SRPBCC family protein [Mangrovimonas sp.]MCB0437819.1 SRPBCC family protein [Mangrovimonas sp.]HPF96947.1 SRPBCC family protein [Mangrovimonas sp.]HRV55063.1 SRPBCC family protein [Mangrovimonas sp.]